MEWTYAKNASGVFTASEIKSYCSYNFKITPGILTAVTTIDVNTGKSVQTRPNSCS